MDRRRSIEIVLSPKNLTLSKSCHVYSEASRLPTAMKVVPAV
jgi:hypothetical protein